MDKRSVFEKDGKHYEILRAGIEFYVAKNGSHCIRLQGETKPIAIQKAIQKGFISEVLPAEKGDLFPNPKQLDPEKIEEKDAIAEPHPPECLETKKIRSAGDNIYFMPVDQLRAQVFLAHGLIYPAVYDKAGLSGDFHDSQRQTPACLTLCETPQPLHQDQLLLRVLLHPNEIAAAERDGDVLHLAIPLPISRLTGIQVPTAPGGLDRYIDGWVKPDVPVPRHLFTNAADPLSSDQENSNWGSPPRDAQPNPSIAESIIRFDRYLGVMAFLRNVARYFSENTGHYADYPDVFFAVYERIISKPGLTPSSCPTPAPLLLALLGFDTEMTDTAKSILSLANSQEPYIDKAKGHTAHQLAWEIYKTTGEKEVLKEAFGKLFSGDYRSAISKLQGSDIPVEAAVLAGLLQFSVRQSSGYRTVKQRLHEDWSNQNPVCLALAALGAYYGYTALDARETALYSVHPLIRPLIEEHPEIKFHLKTHFERELIEAIYQRAFSPDAPIQDSSPLFSTVIKPPVSADPKVRSSLVADKSYSVRDLVVRQYDVTRIGRFIQWLKAWKRNTIDRQSAVGRVLMGSICDYANESGMTCKEGRPPFQYYNITKNKLIELIEDGTVAMEPEVLECLELLIKKDNA